MIGGNMEDEYLLPPSSNVSDMAARCDSPAQTLVATLQWPG